MTRWKHFPLGLRTLKTGIAVTLAVLLVRLFVTDELSVFYAAFGALIAMERTFSGSLKQALSQLIGVVAGTILGLVMLLLFPQATPAWAAGIGVVLLLLLLCNVLKLNFVASFSCIIFLSASLTPTGNVLRDSLFRLRDTAAGIAVALVVNAVIVPYNNKVRIRSLLTQLRAQIPQQVESIVIFERFPDLKPNVELLRRIDRELQLYHNQRFFHRRHDEEAALRGCRQLAGRMVEELEAICGMDTLGDLSTENAETMRTLGMALPEAGIAGRKCTRHDTIVMNYHLEKLLSACRYLAELMEQPE